MSKIQELPSRRTDSIDYGQLFGRFPWIIEKNLQCIISPDSDGLLCGLFMSNFLGWKIKGFYDGKIVLIDKEVSAKDCIFLDMDIFRKEIRSVGHHMVLYNKKRKPPNWDNYANCIQPNNLRDYDKYNDFKLKYPLATIHLLLAIVGQKIKIEIMDSAICPLLYTDGVFKNLFGYPENCIDWLRYLDAINPSNTLHAIFLNEYYSIHDLMLALEKFFKRIGGISKNKRGNDKVRISNSKGEAVNIAENTNGFIIKEDERKKSETFLSILSELTGWDYKKSDWLWDGFKLRVLIKKSAKPNNNNFEKMTGQNPVSWAMTSGSVIEYTLDERNILLK